VKMPYEIHVGKFPNHAELAAAIDDFLALSTKAKEVERQAAIAKATISAFCEERWVSLFASTGLLPPTPFRLVTFEGRAVNYVVQDKSSGYELKPEVDEELKVLVGDKRAAELIRTDLVVQFDRDVMREPTPDGARVGDVVGTALANWRNMLASDGLVSADQARRLFHLRFARVLQPGFLGRLPSIAGKAAHSFSEVLSVLGNAVVRFVRA